MSSPRTDNAVVFERAFALMDQLDERTAERLEPTPFGPVVVHSHLNRVHDLNFLRAEKPGDATAEELAARPSASRAQPESVTAASTSEAKSSGSAWSRSSSSSAGSRSTSC